MKRILIVEDNAGQREVLSSTLRKISTEYSVIECSTSKDALEAAREWDIDLFFIDIGLPDGSGLDLAEKLRQIEKYELVWIVFLTTYSEFILDAFRKIHCYDYIVKPYKIETVIEMTKKLIQNSHIKKEPSESKFLSFPMRGYILKINLDDIIFIEVFNKSITVHTKYQKQTIRRLSLKELRTMLPADIFIQCHRSYIVNVNYITRIDKNNYIWEVSFGDYPVKAFVGETYRSTLLEKFKNDNLEVAYGIS